MAVQSNTFSLCKPFYFILKFFGLACFTIDEKTKKLRSTLFDKILFVFILTIWIICSWIQFSRRMPSYVGSSVADVILDSLWYHQHNIQHVFGVLVILFNFKQRKIVGKLVKTLLDFDQKAETLGWIVNSQKLIFAAVVSTFSALVVLTAVASALYAYKYEWIQRLTPATIAFNTISYSIILLFFLVVSQQFIVGAFCVRSRITTIARNFE